LQRCMSCPHQAPNNTEFGTCTHSDALFRCCARLAAVYATEALSAAAPLPARALAGAALVVLARPQRCLRGAELAALHALVGSGGALLVLSAAGGDRRAGAYRERRGLDVTFPGTCRPVLAPAHYVAELDHAALPPE